MASVRNERPVTETVAAMAEFLRARLDEEESAWGELTNLALFASYADLARNMTRDIEAKRRIIYINEKAAASPPKDDGYAEARARQTIRHLASVYSGHPDYREEWKP